MFGNFYQSCLSFSSFLWEPIGVLMGAGLLWAIWQNRMKWRDPLVWLVAGGMVTALAWRLHFHITTGRYYGIFIVPALLFSFYLLWRGPWSGRTACILISILLAVCLGRDLWHNPMERDVLSLYETVRKDARQFERVTALSFSKGVARERFYTGLTISGVDRETSLKNILSGLDCNFSVFDGDWDAVYLFLEIRQKELPAQAGLLSLAPPGRLTLLGDSWLDRHRKKKVIALRYLPSGERMNRQLGELLPNGDFRDVVNEKDRIQMQKDLGRRAVRFFHESPVFPRQWRIYHSLIQKSNSFATVVTRDDENSLRLEADSYLALVSPSFEVAQERLLNFSVYAETESVLQITREVKFIQGNGELYPMLPLQLKPGEQRRFSIRLPERPDCKSGSVWFWLHQGILEISDVRIQ